MKGHIERRFSTVWDSPGPRLREYVLSLRAIWDCWQHGTPLNYQGRFYQFTLMTPSSTRADADPLRIDLAAINPYNVESAATLPGGLRVHGFNTAGVPARRHLARRGRCRRARRPLDDFEMIGGGFIASGADERGRPSGPRAGPPAASPSTARPAPTPRSSSITAGARSGRALRELIAQAGGATCTPW